MIFEHITHSLGKGLYNVQELVTNNYGNTSGFLVSERYKHVLEYCQVILQISQFNLSIHLFIYLGGGVRYKFLMILPLGKGFIGFLAIPSVI